MDCLSRATCTLNSISVVTIRVKDVTLPLDLVGFNFANLRGHVGEIGYIRPILFNSTTWQHVIFAKLKPPGNEK